MKVYSLAMQKGGVGKTTTAVNVGFGLYHKGKKVLFVDLDPQANLTFATGTQDSEIGTLELLQGETLNNCITPIKDGIDIVTATWDLLALESEDIHPTRLKDALKGAQYDYVIIDTPPTPNALQYQGIIASDRVIVPVNANRYSYEGLTQIYETVQALKEANKKLKFEGVVLCNYENRSNLAKQMKENIIVKANKLHIAYLGTIRKGIAVEESTFKQTDLYEYAPHSNPTQDYMELVNTLCTDI